ncbi:MAG: 16S rRNA (cytidine(1402)-2'-O)-methyltransferase [Reyranellaceae bacterium]
MQPTTVPDATDVAPPSKPRPGLYVVGTPIGNARDITLRALDTLRGADLIACEDTRVSRPFLAGFGIAAPLLACHDHNEAAAARSIIAALEDGKVVALISDAGMPLVSDPGHRVVTAVIDAGQPVTVVPGPSAPLAALALSGLPSDQFMFAGFLPARATERRRAIASLAGIDATLLLFEAPHRLVESLEDLASLLGARPAAVTRELTKRFEEVRRAPLDQLAAYYRAEGPPRGEIVIVVGPPDADAVAVSSEDIDAALRTAMAGGSVKEAAAEVAARFGRPRREVYARALELKRTEAG